MPAGVSQDKARLYWTMREADLPALLRPEDKAKLLGLTAAGIELQTGVAPPLRDTRVEHTTPLIHVGSIERPYLFPEALVALCRKSWAERTIRASFRGLLTPQRRRMLEPWDYVGIEEIRVTATTRGRDYATKYYDKSYFEELGRSQFVLSPDGDCPFAYRTIEAVLCGAQVVCQTKHPSYGDLQLLTFDEVDAQSLPEWSQRTAEINFRICKRMVTVEAEKLVAEVLRLRGAR